MAQHHVLWTSPAPLWGRFGEVDEAGAILARFASVDQARPAILRFDTDEFMERMLDTLARSPRDVGKLVARPETWRTPLAETAALMDRRMVPRRARLLERLKSGSGHPEPIAAVAHEMDGEVNAVARKVPLKLFQPAHQRHYLVAANLVCAQAGFPDRAIATGGRELVGVVLRRLLPPSPAIAGVERVEFAFVKDAGGARWQRVVTADQSGGSEAQLVEGEELLPLFPLNFADDQGHPRRIHAGVVPVGRREEYMTTRMQQAAPAPEVNPGVAAQPSPIAERKEQFRTDVSEPWKNVIRSVVYARSRVNRHDADNASPRINIGSNPTTRAAEVAKANANAQAQSWLVLLDFADYLKLHVTPVWDRIVDPTLSPLSGGAKTLSDWLASSETRPAVAWPGLVGEFSFTLAQALKRVVDSRVALERTMVNFPDEDAQNPWPAFRYLLAGIGGTDAASWPVHGLHEQLASKAVTPAPGAAGGDDADPDLPTPVPPALQEAESAAAAVDKLVQLVMNAIDLAQEPAPTPPLPFAARLRDALKTTQGDEGWFAMRCVYVRCDCGPLQPAVLSEPSVRFQLAGFFDPDAPARPIRIALPLDTTPAGLRKFNKNAAFMMSDVLCGQVQRAKSLGLIDLVLSVLPWPLHKDLDMGGMGPCKSQSETIGMICSLSIPIVTICALILLMIIVSLLDFIFRWMPWLVVCLPIPKGLKAKVPGASP